MAVRKMLFRIARSKPMGCLIGKAAQYCPSAIPARKVYLDKWVVAFRHPVPSYEQHAVFLPRKWIRSVLQVQDTGLLRRVLKAAEQAAQSSGWSDRPLMFCVNAGRRQDVGQLHFHLVSLKEALVYDMGETETLPRELAGCMVCGTGKRFVIRSTPAAEATDELIWQHLLRAAVTFCTEAAREMDLSREGFSLRILKRPSQCTFDKVIYLDFDRAIMERRTNHESSSHL